MADESGCKQVYIGSDVYQDTCGLGQIVADFRFQNAAAIPKMLHTVAAPCSGDGCHGSAIAGAFLMQLNALSPVNPVVAAGSCSLRLLAASHNMFWNVVCLLLA